jgi:hypothetical protein
METVKDKTCAARIDGELKGREQDLADLFRIIDDRESGDTAQDSAYDDIYNFAYGIDTTQVTRVIWSGGGPADFIDIFHNLDGITRVEYIYQDWYDGARREISENSPVWRYADLILETHISA